jgi:hypothetical protein
MDEPFFVERLNHLDHVDTQLADRLQRKGTGLFELVFDSIAKMLGYDQRNATVLFLTSPK